MPHQSPVTVAAPLRPDALEEVQRRLAAGSLSLPFDELPGLHFAKVFVLPGAADHRGPVPARLVYVADVDGSPRRHLRELVERAGPELDDLFAACRAYPGVPATRGQRLGYLSRHQHRTQAWYVNTVGRGLEQVLLESRLRDDLQDWLDGRRAEWADADQVLRAVREHVAADPALAGALHPPAPTEPGWRLRERAHLVAVPLALLALSPALAALLPAWAVLLRRHEEREPVGTRPPDPEHARRLAEVESHHVHNAFAAVGFVKPGAFRALTTRAVLFLTDYGSRHVFNSGSLAGVTTIHFARWVTLDGGRRVMFISHYDGSLESYMNDFVDKVAWGLNAVFSNGVEYPRTRWLFAGGARDELEFKKHLRTRQVPVPLWYSAYPGLTASNLGTNAAIRSGLSEPDRTDVRDWAARL